MSCMVILRCAPCCMFEAKRNPQPLWRASLRPCVSVAALAVLTAFACQYGRLARTPTLAELRHAIDRDPDDGGAQARLALALLDHDRTALLGYDRTAPPPADTLDEARRSFERAIMLQPQAADSHRAHRALLQATGRAEEALSAGSKVLELDISARSYMELAGAMLVATCSHACRARIERRQEAQGHEPRTSHSASYLEAAGMWRVMEAGRLYEQAARHDPSHSEARRLSRATAKLRKLDAYRVSTADELFELASCKPYLGRRLDGKTCTADGSPLRKKRNKLRGRSSENNI